MLTSSNFLHSYLCFQDREAGVSAIYCNQEQRYHYHAYCLETKLMRDLVSIEFNNLEEAISYINDEFASWSLKNFQPDKKGCSNCHAHP